MQNVDIRNLFRKQPFEPLRIIVSDGSVYDIYHPDLIWVGATSSSIGFSSQEGSPYYERTVWVDNGHISRIIPVRLAKENAVASGKPD